MILLYFSLSNARNLPALLLLVAVLPVGYAALHVQQV
jgi:hypothetical protein